MTFERDARTALADGQLRGALRQATTLFGERRRAALATVPDWEGTRDRARAIKDEPRRLLRHVRGVELVELPPPGAETCCGFGGTFAVKYPEISVAILDEKVDAIERAGVDAVVSGDASCLMQIGGRLSRRGSSVRALHLAEVLASTS